MAFTLEWADQVNCENKTFRTMAECATDMIVRNLIQSLQRLHDDLERVEMWAAALNSFLEPAPDYQPGGQHLLPRPKAKPPEH